MKNSKPLVFVGAGGLAREVFEWFKVQPEQDLLGPTAGYISDDGADELFESNTGLRHLGKLESLSSKADYRFVVCIGDPAVRRKFCEEIEIAGAEVISLIHPTTLIASTARLGRGVILFPFVVVSSNACVGNHVIINSYSGIGHDVLVGNFSTISAQVDLTGHVKIGENVLLGSGVRVVPGKTVGEGCRVSAGITVIRSCKAGEIILPTVNKYMR